MIPSQLVKSVEIIGLLELLLAHMIELNTANDGSLLHIRVYIIQAFLDCLLKILGNTFEAQ